MEWQHDEDLAGLAGLPFLEAVLETAPTLIVAIDQQGVLRYFNPACERIMGYSRAEVLGRPFAEIFLIEEEVESVGEVVATLVRDQDEVYHENYWVTKSGERRMIGWSNRTIRSETGEFQVILSIGNDVTELREAEARARRTEERFRLFSTSVDVALWEWNRREQRFEYFTDAFTAVFGFPVDAVLADPYSLFEKVHPDDRDRTWEFWQTIHERPAQFEYRVILADNSVRWIRSKASPRGDSAIYGTSEDVTAIVQARRRLERNEQLLAEAQESANLGSWEIEVVSGKIAWTKQTFALYDRDYERGEPTVKEYFAEIGEAERVNAMSLYRQAIRRGTSVDYELVRTRRDGTVQLLHVIGKPFRDPDGGVRRIAGSVQDVTKARQAEIRLQNEREFLRSVIDTDPNFIFVRDRDGRFVIVNQAVANQLKRTPAELTGKHLSDVNPNPLAVQAFLASDRQIFDSEQDAVNYETMVPDVPPRYLQTSKRLIRDPDSGEKLVLGISVDITKMKQVEFDLKAAKDQAEAASRLKSEFIANVSHEIRTPLNGVIGIADILATGELSGEQRRHLATLRRSAENLRYTLNDVLDFSKIEAGYVMLEYVEVDIFEVLEEIIELHAATASERNLWLRLEADYNVTRLVRADRHRLIQIIGNLLSNGLKFTERGGVTLVVSSASGMVEIAVCDTGIGVSESRRAAIFDSFAQADDTIARRFGGTGLGLAIVKQLTEIMGGTVNCTSVEGVGSQFIVSFPLWGVAERLMRPWPALEIQVEGGEAAVRTAFYAGVAAMTASVDRVTVNQLGDGYRVLIDDQERGWKGPFIHSRLRSVLANFGTSRSVSKGLDEAIHRSELVLVVEDNPVNQFVVQEQLRILGFSSVVANRAREAIEMVQQQTFDLILMDIQMPEMDGLEAASRMRRLKQVRTTPIVAITAFATPDDAVRSRAAGMDDYLTKPVALDDLRRVMTRWLPGSEPFHPSKQD